jgi:hypothetical protein
VQTTQLRSHKQGVQHNLQERSTKSFIIIMCEEFFRLLLIKWRSVGSFLQSQFPNNKGWLR